MNDDKRVLIDPLMDTDTKLRDQIDRLLHDWMSTALQEETTRLMQERGVTRQADLGAEAEWQPVVRERVRTRLAVTLEFVETIEAELAVP